MLKKNEISRLHAVRGALLKVLGPGETFKLQDLVKRLTGMPEFSRRPSQPVLKNWVSVTLQLYNTKFYRDFSTGRWSLTKSELERQKQLREAERASWRRRRGNTQAGIVGELMEARGQ